MAIEWEMDHWKRSLSVGFQPDALYGLPELVDNNPLVCADHFCVPDEASTLALIALGPLARASIIVEPPTVIFSLEPDPEEVHQALNHAGVPEGTSLVVDAPIHNSVLACSAMAVIETPDSLSMLDELYDEAYGRCFFVREVESGSLQPESVADQPFAHYALRVTQGDTTSLLTVQVLADRHGKCGAAQLVHALNIMCGFEESLGIV